MAVKGRKNRTIYLSISEKDYELFAEDNAVAHTTITKQLKINPQAFPEKMLKEGYKLNGRDRKSKKMNIQLRRIKVGDVVYRICPSYIIPGMIRSSLLGISSCFWKEQYVLVSFIY
jgi:hypothetical protein